MDPHTEDHAHVVPYSTFIKIWAALIVLTGVTVGAALLDLGHLAFFTAIVVATVKATLVTLYFMHIRFERRIFAGMLIAILVTYAIFVILTFADYAFRPTIR